MSISKFPTLSSLVECEIPVSDLRRFMNQLRLPELGSCMPPFRPSPPVKTKRHVIGIGQFKFHDNKLKITLDVKHFTSGTITVKAVDGFVSIKGKRDEKRDKFGFIAIPFTRRYPMPVGCLPETLEAKMTSAKVLIVTCVRKPLALDEKPFEQLSKPKSFEEMEAVDSRQPIRKLLFRV